MPYICLSFVDGEVKRQDEKTRVLAKNGSVMELRNGITESSDSSERDSEEKKVIWFFP